MMAHSILAVEGVYMCFVDGATAENLDKNQPYRERKLVFSGIRTIGGGGRLGGRKLVLQLAWFPGPSHKLTACSLLYTVYAQTTKDMFLRIYGSRERHFAFAFTMQTCTFSS